MQQQRVELLHSWLNTHMSPELQLLTPCACRYHQRLMRLPHGAAPMLRPLGSSHSDRDAIEINRAEQCNSIVRSYNCKIHRLPRNLDGCIALDQQRVLCMAGTPGRHREGTWGSWVASWVDFSMSHCALMASRACRCGASWCVTEGHGGPNFVLAGKVTRGFRAKVLSSICPF